MQILVNNPYIWQIGEDLYIWQNATGHLFVILYNIKVVKPQCSASSLQSQKQFLHIQSENTNSG